jgi:hypothetical protein
VSSYDWFSKKFGRFFHLKRPGFGWLVNAAEFWFSERFLFLSHVKHISVEF